MNNIAVLTGDIIDSTKLSPKELEEVLNELEDELEQYEQEKLAGYYEMYRGDAVQLVIPDTERALELAYRLKTRINSIVPENKKVKRGLKVQRDIRIALGIGTVDKIPTNKLTNEKPFVLSGKALDKLAKSGKTIGISTGNEDRDHELETSLFLYEGISRQWSLATAQVVHQKLKHKVEQEIAQELGISQSAVNQHSQAAYWVGLQSLLNRFEEIIRGMEK